MNEAKHAYRLTGGAIVHAVCREDYVAAKKTSHWYPAIEAALYQGYPLNRFQLCAQCQAPIWDSAKPGNGKPVNL